MTNRDEARERLVRPIIGIENRTAQEVFDIMSDRFQALLSPEEVGGSDQPVAWRCDGCGRLAKDPSADLATMQAAGAVSCCPERKIEPLFRSRRNG